MPGQTALVGRYPIVICIAIALHLVWSLGLLMDPVAVNATGPHALLIIAGDASKASLLFVTVAALASIGVMEPQHPWRALFILPQQIVLWFSAVGAGRAMFLGTFADGTIRTSWFLIVDQVLIVLLTLGHTVSLLLMTRDR